MESKKFALLLQDVKSSKYNVSKIDIMECYVAKRFSVSQILQLLESVTISDAKLTGFKLLMKEMLVCKLDEAISLITAMGTSTDVKDKDNQFSCLEELIKYNKLNLKESDKHTLFALFQGTNAEEEACELLKINPQSSSTHLPAIYQKLSPPGAPAKSHKPTSTTKLTQHPSIVTNDNSGPNQQPSTTSTSIGTLRHSSTIPSDNFGPHPSTKSSDTIGQHPSTLPYGSLGYPIHSMPSGTLGQPPTISNYTLGQNPYTMPTTVGQPPPAYPTIYHNSIANHPPYQPYYQSGPDMYPNSVRANTNVINPSAIGYIMPQDSTNPLQRQTTLPTGFPPGIGFNV